MYYLCVLLFLLKYSKQEAVKVHYKSKLNREDELLFLSLIEQYLFIYSKQGNSQKSSKKQVRIFTFVTAWSN